ncbi:MAG: autoinducer binding domain-containing protein [Amaricoccus sp.]|uniref:helix-turn-helix transcriptional regulator n=1 Tax=Amaricoccus sp. TaxID=1872485 RepID=UPI0039E5727F
MQTTSSIDELQVWAHELRDFCDVTHVFYHTATLKREQIGAFTYSRDWARRYVERNYLSIDPVLQGAMRRFHPMDWKTLDWSSPAARAFLLDAMEHGLGNQGWTVPIWGPQGEFAVFCLNHQCSDADWSRFTSQSAKDILVVSHLMHEQALRIINRETAPPSADLSPREREALAHLSVGHSRAAVADMLQISENTLRAYIDSARHKLGALNVTHAVALALAKGIITPQGALPKY